MKRQFNIIDGLFLMALYFKITGTGLTLTWPQVFYPYIIEAAWALIAAICSLWGVSDRVKLFLFKFTMKRKIKIAADSARSYMKGVEKKAKASNPGQFVDPSKSGK